MYKCINGRVLLRAIEQKQSTGGIFIPETAKSVSQQGEVIVSDNADVPSGSMVLYNKSETQIVTIDKESLLVVESKDIYGVFERQ